MDTSIQTPARQRNLFVSVNCVYLLKSSFVTLISQRRSSREPLGDQGKDLPRLPGSGCWPSLQHRVLGGKGLAVTTTIGALSQGLAISDFQRKLFLITAVSELTQPVRLRASVMMSLRITFGNICSSALFTTGSSLLTTLHDLTHLI